MVHSLRQGPGIPRLRSVISWSRPSHAGRPDDGRLARLWDDCRASVGAIRVGGTCFATAWRLPGDKPRVATAGHVLWWLLRAGTKARAWGGPVVGGADVVFDDNGQNGATGIPIVRYALAHPSWDLCILELDPLDGTVLPEPLPLAAVQQSGENPFGQDSRDIAVIGYPGDLDGTDQIFRGSGLRHISAGVVLTPSALGAALRDGGGTGTLAGFRKDWQAAAAHDASTCPGFSGAPVFDVDTGKVVGIHIWGSALDPGIDRESDWNDMVDLSAARCDPWLDDNLHGSDTQAPLPDRHPNWTGSQPSQSHSPEFMRGIGRRLHRLRPGYLLSGVTADRPDFRDLPFVPSLAAPPARVLPPGNIKIGDQRSDATCAAFAVAAAIEPQLARPGKAKTRLTVSVRMLDALGRDHDEFMDDDATGTTLRGVLKGFFHNGVCLHGTAAAGGGDQPFLLTRRMAKEARGITLGAYFRVAPVLSDMQMAVQQAGAVVVSAHVHKGWQPPPSQGRKKRKPVEAIPFDGPDDHPREGAHAFLVTGYTDKGFVVQNSWGRDWGAWDGRPGHALWSYADWAANVIDAWVVRISASTPSAFGLIAGQTDPLPAPRRAQLLGHMIQTEADAIVERGTLGLGLAAIRETTRFLGGTDPRDQRSAADYTHLLVVFHDAMLGGDLISRIAARMTPRLKAHGIYPIHLCHGLDELRTLSLRLTADAELVRAGFAGSLLPSDGFLERHAALTSQRLIEDYRRGARQSPSLAQALAEILAPGVRHPPWMDAPRKVVVLAAGTGAIPAMARAGSFDRAVPRIFLAPPVTVGGRGMVWRLGPERREGPVPGYPGEWVDLLARSLGQAAVPRGTDPRDPGFGWSSLSDALIDPALPARLRGL